MKKYLLLILLVLALGSGCADNKKQVKKADPSAKSVGHDAGKAVREVGTAAKNVGKEIGKGFKDFGKAFSDAVKNDDKKE